MLTIEQLNNMPDNELASVLSQCCASHNWVKQLITARPYRAVDEISQQTAFIWNKLSEQDYLEAFAAHPMIGDLASLQKKYANTAQTAASEQASTAQADESTLRELQELNHQYKQRHGFIFIIFASGKSASDMLQYLKQRINNDTATEVRNAAEEQLKITQLRIKKLFSPESL